MSDNLEKFVKKNRASFDSEVPSELVWESIEKSIPKKKKVAKIISINRQFLWAAAAVLVFAFLVIFYQGSLIKSLKTETAEIETESTPEQWQLPTELQELDMVYTSQQKSTMSLLDEFPDQQHELREELNELDAEFEALKTELGAEHSTQDVLHAMIVNYRIKIDLLEVTLKHLKRSEKIIEDESTTL